MQIQPPGYEPCDSMTSIASLGLRLLHDTTVLIDVLRPTRPCSSTSFA